MTYVFSFFYAAVALGFFTVAQFDPMPKAILDSVFWPYHLGIMIADHR
jgi:hypothetical protein